MNNVGITYFCLRHGSRLFRIFILLFFFTLTLTARDAVQQPSRQNALDAFSRGDYEKAYSNFSRLLELYPKDPLYKYYAGVCLVKLEKDPDMAASLLSDAVAGSGTVRPVPVDVWFWLGRAQHLAGRFGEASDSYERFTSLAGKKIAREMDVPGFVKQCSERKGNIATLNPPAGKNSITEEKKNLPAIKLMDITQTAGEAKTVIPSHEKEYAPPAVDTVLANLLAAKTSKAALPDSDMTNRRDIAKNETETKLVPTVPAERKNPVFSQFEIIEKPVFNPSDKVPFNPDVPSGLVYRIQVAIFRNPVNPSYFKGLSPMQCFRNEGSDLNVYYAGLFRRAADASAALLKVRSQGFKDAFVVALMDKKQVSLERASVLEKEWSSKPLFEITLPETPRDTVPPTLVFRVEVILSL